MTPYLFRYSFFLICVFTMNHLAAQEELIPFRDGTKWGYVNGEKKLVIAPQYEDADIFKNGFAVVKQSGKYGVINKNNKIVVPFGFDQVESYGDGLFFVWKSLKCGVYDSMGKEIIPVMYNGVTRYSRHFRVRLRDKKSGESAYGLLDLKGREVFPVLYEDISITYGHSMYGDISDKRHDIVELEISQEEKQYIMFDTLGNRLSAKSYNKLELLRNGYYKCGKSNGVANREKLYKYSLMKSGTEITGQDYDEIVPLSNGMFKVEDSKQFGLLDSNGKVVIEPRYEKMGYISEGLIPVMLADKWFYIDSTGFRVLPKKYDAADEFSRGIAIVGRKISVNGRSATLQGVIDKTGKEILPPDFSLVSDFSDYGKQYADVLVVKNQTGKCGVTDLSGKTLVPFMYNQIARFDERGWAIAVKDTLIDNKPAQIWGMIDKQGKIRIPFCYTGSIQPFRNGLAKVRNFTKAGDVYGMIDTTGKEVIPVIYGEIDEFKNGYAKVKKSARVYMFGIIDSTGKVIVPLLYSAIMPFFEGLAIVYVKDTVAGKLVSRMGYVNMKGEIEIEPKYESVEGFHNGVGIIKLNGKYGLISRSGKEILPPIYYHLSIQENVIWASETYDKRGILDLKGSVIIPIEYKEISLNGGYYLAKWGDDKKGYFDKKGNKYFKE